MTTLQEAAERDLAAIFDGITLEGTDPPYGIEEQLPDNYDLTTFDDAMWWEERHECKHTPNFVLEFNAVGRAQCPHCLRIAVRDGEVIRWAGPNEPD